MTVGIGSRPGRSSIASRIAAGVAEQEPTSVSSRRSTSSKSTACSVSHEEDEQRLRLQRRERAVQAGVGAEHRRVHRPVGRLGAVAERQVEPVGERVGRQDVVALPDQRLDEGDPRTADDEHTSAWNSIDGAKDAGERLGESARRVVEPVRKRDRRGGADAFGEAAGNDPAPGSARTSSRAPPGSACTRRSAVHEHDAPPGRVLGDDLVAEHGARGGPPELLGVGAAEAAGPHAHEPPGPSGSGRSACAGCPASSRTTARMAPS